MPTHMQRSEDRITLVTGGNRGLGFETCRQLANLGLRVILTARDGQQGEQAAAELSQQTGAEVVSTELDVTDPASVKSCVDRLQETVGRVDVLVNNAGIMPDRGGFDEQRRGASVFNARIETLELAMATHVYGPLRLIQACVPLMRARGYGRIVNVSSTLGQLSSMTGGWPGYRVSKAALNALTLIVAAEVADSNILVNSVCPGWTRTHLGGPKAPRDVAEGADTIVWLATLPDDGPRGGFFQDRQPIPW
ncbi:MAG: SDR family oxidoreductase [Pseudomonadota bacterium]|nr:SDR family oxidoreductase [Pseudomonadota bacterium]